MPEPLPPCACGSTRWVRLRGDIYCDACGHTPYSVMGDEEYRKFQKRLAEQYGRR